MMKFNDLPYDDGVKTLLSIGIFISSFTRMMNYLFIKTSLVKKKQ